MQYFFTLGNHPELSKAEIEAKFEQLNIKFQVITEQVDFVILNIDQTIEHAALIRQLAGTIKIGKINGPLKSLSAADLAKFIPDSKEKIRFGVSPYNLNIDVDKIGRQIKSLLKNQGAKARFVASKISPLSSVVVQKNLLGKNGIELAILRFDNQTFVGQTLAVQPFELFSKLDFGRPARDDFSGMLPLKLAQIMVNLAGTDPKQSLLDPFCGSGTILQQAIFLGHKNVIGADASKKATKDTQENLDWLAGIAKENNLPFSRAKILLCPIEHLVEKIKPASMDAIITEPYLGPPLKGHEPESFLLHIISELTKLYRPAIKSMATILKPSGTIIMVIPTFRINGRLYQFDLHGLLPRSLKIIESWEYSRPDQKIIRNIYRLKKQ